MEDLVMELSVITINKNNQEGLERTIESVVKQKFNEFEYIIIDGASTDNSCEIIIKYEKAISYWVSEEDTGIYNAMNKGIRKATGKYCLFLNSGDFLFNENTLSSVTKKLDDKEIVYGNVIAFDSTKKHFLYYPHEITLDVFYTASIPHSGGSFIKRELFKKFGFYNEDYKIVSDWEFFIKTILFGNVTTLHLDSFFSYFDLEGVSTRDLQLMHAERRLVLEAIIPERILRDYDKRSNNKNDPAEMSILKLVSLLVKKISHIS